MYQTRIFRHAVWWTLPSLLLAAAAHATAAVDAGKPADSKAPDSKDSAPAVTHFAPEQQSSKGSVTIDGHRIDYDAYAGTLVVHPKDWDDVPQNAPKDEDKNPRPEASMFYVAYFKTADKGSADKSNADRGGPTRPITFVYNGGPGSSTRLAAHGRLWADAAWLPRTIHTRRPRPYPLINNDYSLLDATDLVFIDAPGTGLQPHRRQDKEKAFYGVDQDAHAFADFIAQFLSKYGRWNSPKYLFGESYGTHALRGADQRCSRPSASSTSTASSCCRRS